MTKAEVAGIIEDVANARGMTAEEIVSKDCGRKVAAARRAICVIVLDKYSLKQNHFQAVPWVEIARMMNKSRSTLFHAARAWSSKEGSQDGEKENDLREKGCLLQQGKESIHEMAKRVCKRRLGRRKELGYWRSEGQVSHG